MLFIFIFALAQTRVDHVHGSPEKESLKGCSINENYLSDVGKEYFESQNLSILIQSILHLENQSCAYIDIVRKSFLSYVFPDIERNNLAIFSEKNRIFLLNKSNHAISYLQQKMNQINNNGKDEIAVISQRYNFNFRSFSLFANSLVTSNGYVMNIALMNQKLFQAILNSEIYNSNISIPAWSTTILLFNTSRNLRNFALQITEMNSGQNGFYSQLPANFKVPIESDFVISWTNFGGEITKLNEWLNLNFKLLEHDSNAQKSVDIILGLQKKQIHVASYLSNCGFISNGISQGDCDWNVSSVQARKIYFNNYSDSSYDGSKTLANFQVCCSRNTLIHVLKCFSNGYPSLSTAIKNEKNENAAIFVSYVITTLGIESCTPDCIKDIENLTNATLYEEGGKHCRRNHTDKIQCGSKKVFDEQNV